MTVALLDLLIEPLTCPPDRVEHSAQRDKRRDHCRPTGETRRDNEVAQRHWRFH